MAVTKAKTSDFSCQILQEIHNPLEFNTQEAVFRRQCRPLGVEVNRSLLTLTFTYTCPCVLTGTLWSGLTPF